MLNQTEFHKNQPTFSQGNTFEKVSRLLDFDSGVKLNILDVGCGSGFLAGHLQYLGHNVTGLDIRNPQDFNFEFIECDINLAWPVKNNFYDLVICTDVAEHLYEPGNILEQAKAVLKPEGKIIFGVPNHFDLRQRLRMLFGKGIVHWDNLRHNQHSWDYAHIRFFNLPELGKFFEQHGWFVQSVQFNFMGAGILPSSLMPEFLKIWLLKLWPNLFSGKFVFLLSSKPHPIKKIFLPLTPKGY